MYTLLRSLTTSSGLKVQLTAILIALGLTELFIKLHSFLLEALCFLAIWFVADLLLTQIFHRRPNIAKTEP